MVDDGEVLRDIDEVLSKPSAARVYDYFLGGTHYYAIDQAFAEKIRARLPVIPQSAVTCRQFLGRAVRYCVRSGITQFLDIGSGLPTQGNVHEVADQARPRGDTRVVYVDNEPIALLHSEMLLADTADKTRHKAIAGDLLRPVDLWNRVVECRILDPKQPIALVINSVLHFFKDEQNPGAALAFFRRQVVPGSMLVLSHITAEDPSDEDEQRALQDLAEYYEDTTNPGQVRDSTEVKRFFGDWDLVEPGLVFAPAWHPDKETVLVKRPSKSRIMAGVARKG